MNPTITSILVVATLGTLHAQSPLSGFAQGFVVTEGAANSIQRKPVGDAPLTPFANTNDGFPIFTITALLHRLANPHAAAPHFNLNAMSTGNDNLPAREVEGQVEWEIIPPPTAGWAAIAVSVAQQPDYDDALDPSVFFSRVSTQGHEHRGSDLFSYWFAGNTSVSHALVDASFFEIGPEHMSLAATRQITSLDTYMPAVVDARGQWTPTLRVLDRWYFTLTPETVLHLQNTQNWQSFSPAFSISQAEIGTSYVYRSEWTGSGWKEIEVAFTPLELGLTAEHVIDAIAYFDIANHDDKIAFSLTSASSGGFEQILIGGPGVGPTPQETPRALRAQGGARITTKIGIGLDTDVDSLCTYDPEIAAGFEYCSWLAWPVPPTTTSPNVEFGSSAQRLRLSSTYDEMLLQATGLPNVPGEVIWFVSVGSRPPVRVSKLNPGTRAETLLKLPTSLNLPGADIVIKTFFVSASGQVKASWPLKILGRANP